MRSFYGEFARRLSGDAAAPVRLARRTWGLAAIALIGFSVFALPQSAQSQRVYDEYEVKAAFIYNCMLFVDWPNETDNESKKPYTICILGEDPFGKFLNTIARTKTIQSRPIKIQRIKSLEEFKDAHILFISKNEQRNLKKILETVSDKPILTIADFSGFADNGGVLEFLLINNRVNFRVNEKTANQAKLRMSAQLLNLAVEIIRDPEAEGASE
ncbi:MAG: YfiR family protein [Candidatus Hinthialibacter antarcticus]|nr:YfiR family protein [Candidatus Hinthialibacter antarcticus]